MAIPKRYGGPTEGFFRRLVKRKGLEVNEVTIAEEKRAFREGIKRGTSRFELEEAYKKQAISAIQKLGDFLESHKNHRIVFLGGETRYLMEAAKIMAKRRGTKPANISWVGIGGAVPAKIILGDVKQRRLLEEYLKRKGLLKRRTPIILVDVIRSTGDTLKAVSQVIKEGNANAQVEQHILTGSRITQSFLSGKDPRKKLIEKATRRGGSKVLRAFMLEENKSNTLFVMETREKFLELARKAARGEKID